jgi:hypothetical protein
MRDPVTVRQPGYLSREERPMGFAPPPRGEFAFLAAPKRQSARDPSYNSGVYGASARWLILGRTSEKTFKAKFGSPLRTGPNGPDRRQGDAHTAGYYRQGTPGRSEGACGIGPARSEGRGLDEVGTGPPAVRDEPVAPGAEEQSIKRS